MSEHTDDVLSRYLGQHSGMREALLHDPLQQAQVEQLRQTLTMMERALADEGIPDEVAHRVINRIVWGDPEGHVDVHAKMMAVRKQLLAVDLAPDVAKMWREFPSAGPVRPDEEAVVAYRWDSNRGGRHTSNVWCLDCNTEFQQPGTADADLTARDITPGQTCDVCGKDILAGRLPEDQ